MFSLYQVILSFALIPVAFLMGVPWSDCRVVGEVVGLKTVINEFVGYQRLGSYIKANQISVIHVLADNNENEMIGQIAMQICPVFVLDLMNGGL